MDLYVVLIIFLVLVVVGGGVYYAIKYKKVENLRRRGGRRGRVGRHYGFRGVNYLYPRYTLPLRGYITNRYLSGRSLLGHPNVLYPPYYIDDGEDCESGCVKEYKKCEDEGETCIDAFDKCLDDC